MTPIIQLSEAEYYDRLDQPHSPPEGDDSKMAFEAEYYRIYEEVESILARHGENDAYGEGDYNLEPHVTDSRGLGLEVTNPTIVTSRLIDELSDSLRRIDTRWEIYLGSSNYDFGIFISADEAKIFERDGSSLQLQSKK